MDQIKGMLWMDDDKKTTLPEKIFVAAGYFQKKYGQMPTICYVPRSTSRERQFIQGVQIVPIKAILKHHFIFSAEVAA